MQKGVSVPFMLLGGLAVVGLVLGIMFFGQTSQKEYQNILPAHDTKQENAPKVYFSHQLGFELQYLDKDLVVKEDSEEEFSKRGNGEFRKNFKGYVGYEPGKFLGAVAVLDKSNSLDEVASSAYDTNPLTLWVFDNSNNLTIEEWYENFWYYPFLWGDYTERRNNVAPVNQATTSGQLAKYGTVTYQPNSPKFFYLPFNGKMYLFRVIGEKGEEIIQSFKFLKEGTDENEKGCVVAGCSSHLCVEETEGDIITTCEFREEYVCYKEAKCERQQDGKCGWTQTEGLIKCLDEKRTISPNIVF